MPIRSYLKSPEAKIVLGGKPFAAYSVSRRYWEGNMEEVRQMGEEAGGTWLGETHFTALGNQVNSRDHEARRAEEAIRRDPDATTEPQARLRGAGAELRGQRGRSHAQVVRC
jgi:hypothetical protein